MTSFDVPPGSKAQQAVARKNTENFLAAHGWLSGTTWDTSTDKPTSFAQIDLRIDVTVVDVTDQKTRYNRNRAHLKGRTNAQ